MKLNDLKPAPGSKSDRHRVGRGIGSGWGKTAGLGHKGQKARSGGFHKLGFEGGQMPLHRRLPKRGFKNLFGHDFSIINLGRVQQAIESGKLDAGQPITGEILASAGIIGKIKDGVRLLAKGSFSVKADFTVAGASAAAIQAVEAAGGTVTVL